MTWRRWAPAMAVLLTLGCAEGYPEDDAQGYALESMRSPQLLRKLNRYAQQSEPVLSCHFALEGPAPRPPDWHRRLSLHRRPPRPRPNRTVPFSCA